MGQTVAVSVHLQTLTIFHLAPWIAVHFYPYDFQNRDVWIDTIEHPNLRRATQFNIKTSKQIDSYPS
jgi:hypothetical protein